MKLTVTSKEPLRLRSTIELEVLGPAGAALAARLAEPVEVLVDVDEASRSTCTDARRTRRTVVVDCTRTVRHG